MNGVLGVGQVRLRWLGHRLHGEVEVAVAGELTVADGHDVAEGVRHELLHEVPHLSSAIVHADPASVAEVDPHWHVAHHRDPLRWRPAATTRHPAPGSDAKCQLPSSE